MKHFLLTAVWLALVTTLRAEPEMFTNVYVVPPQFIEVSKDRTAKTILEQAGISFLPGSSASYDMEKSQLIVRNTKEQMELVEAYVEALRSGVEKEIFVAIFEVSFQGELKELLERNAADPVVTETASLDEKLIGLFQFTETGALAKKENGAIYFGSQEYLEAEMARPPRTRSEGENERQIRMAGTVPDAEAQWMLRRLSSLPRVGLVKLPNLIMISGQSAMSSLGMRRYGIEAVLGAEESTADLAIYFPAQGKALSRNESGKVEPTTGATIPDGDMVIVAERTSDGNNRLVFIRSLILHNPEKAAAITDRKASGEDLVDKNPQPGATSLSAEEKADVKQADHLAGSAAELLNDGKFSEADDQYAKALKLLPDNDFAAPRRRAYEKQLLRARQGLAK